jgi:Zn-finger nucleic acid-binding protein
LTTAILNETTLCPSCGYDIRGLNFIDEKATCPQCAALVDRGMLRAASSFSGSFASQHSSSQEAFGE